MSEKYIDLRDTIFQDSIAAGSLSITEVLDWLDDHPDQVPGRTITERVKITDTEAYELYESARSFSLDDFKLALESIDGIETVDDPEPTNAEKLETLLRAADADNSTQHYPRFAKWLDQHGVKAPGGDDDH